jgi:hypothetical protein
MSTDVLSLQPQSSVSTSIQYRNFKHLVSDANIKQTQVVTQNFIVSYAPKKWIDLRISMPIIWMFNRYNSIDANTPALKEKKFGAGDLILFSNFRVYARPPGGDKKFGHIFNLGYGMSFPTGNKKSSVNELLQDFNFGTQMVGFYFSGTYSLSYKNWALQNVALVKLNMYNKDDIKYGNVYSYQLAANYTQAVRKVYLMPVLGMRIDVQQKNLHYQYIQAKSGAWILELNAALQCSVKNFSFSIHVSQPVAQKVSGGNILERTGFGCMARYILKKKNKM